MSTSPQPIILVDASNLAYRSYYAMRQLTSPSGMPTGAIYGFLTTLLRLDKSGLPVVVWDHGLPVDPKIPAWRRQLYPTYKIHKTRDDASIQAVIQQNGVTEQILDLMGVCQLGVPGLEADDIVGLVCGLPLSRRLVIYSTDRDFFQLLEAGRVEMRMPSRQGDRRVTASSFATEYGIPPVSWPAVKALGGDSSDEYKPIRGVGLVTALRLVSWGARPAMPAETQPRRVSEWLKMRHVNWSLVRLCYHLAVIHQHWHAQLPQVYHNHWLQQAASLQRYKGWRVGANYEAALESFTRLAAELGMLNVLAKRRVYVRR